MTGWNFAYFVHRIPVHLRHHSGTISKQIEKVEKKQCPKSGVKTNGSQRTSQTAKCVIRTVNTICFKRSDIGELGGLGSRFGSLLGLLCQIVDKKCDSRLQKTRTQKTHQKHAEKGHAGNLSRGVWTP